MVSTPPPGPDLRVVSISRSSGPHFVVFLRICSRTANLLIDFGMVAMSLDPNQGLYNLAVMIPAFAKTSPDLAESIASAKLPTYEPKMNTASSAFDGPEYWNGVYSRPTVSFN